jgi:hypothetical protein
MENDILLEGIIRYTEQDKLKWLKLSKLNENDRYLSNYKISNVKEITFLFNYNINENKSTLSISILISSDRLRQYKYLTSNSLKINRFSELNNIIGKKIDN